MTSPDSRPPGWLERQMFRAVPLWALALLAVTGFALLVVTAWIARHPEGHGRIGNAAMRIADVPETLKRLMAGDAPPVTRPEQLLTSGFWRNAAQPFVDPGHVLVSHYDEGRKRYVVKLLRLSDGATIHEYRPDVEQVIARSKLASDLIKLRRDKNAARNRLIHPLMMPDGGLVMQDSTPLYRVDACGRLMWTVDGIFHHSIERGPDGEIWASYTYPASRQPRVGKLFRDDAIARVTADGKSVSLTSIADILDRNGLGHLWRSRSYVDDPFHLNEVQPVLVSGPYWQRGDLFLSLRNLSLVMLYRPSTGRVLWWRDRPWAFQHDVELIDDHRISIYDNRLTAAWQHYRPVGHNRVLVYDFATGKVSNPWGAAMDRLRIQSPTQGRGTPLPGGDVMIEETQGGRLLRIAPDGTLRWRYIIANARGERYMLGWSRYLGADDRAGIERAEAARCG